MQDLTWTSYAGACLPKRDRGICERRAARLDFSLNTDGAAAADPDAPAKARLLQKRPVVGEFGIEPSRGAGLIKALKDHGMEITAIHNHMLDDEPRSGSARSPRLRRQS